jgi:hypothetical protein
MTDWLRKHGWTIGIAVAISGVLVVAGLALGPSIIAAGAVLLVIAAVALIAGREKQLVTAITAVAAVATVVGLVPTVAEYKTLLPSRSPGAAAPTTAAAALPYGCQGPAGQSWGTAEVAASGGSGADGFSFSAALYALRLEEGQLFVAAAGHIQGAPPSGRQLYLLGAATTTTTDQYGNPGTGWSFPQQRLAQGCWKLNQRRMGYPGACGLTYRYFIASVPAGVADEFDQYKEVHDRDPAKQNNGFTRGRLDQRRVQLLGSFDVPTKALC